MLMFHTTLPEGVSLSPDLRGRAECYVEFQYIGRTYYVPVTHLMCRTYGVRCVSGVYSIPSYSQGVYFEDHLMTVVAAVYLQVRDTVGAEIYRQLSQKITESFQKMFDAGLLSSIQQRMDGRLLPPTSTDDGDLTEEGVS